MDPLENLRKLQERIYETAERLNLKVVGFNLTPDRNAEGRDVVNLTLALTPEAVESMEETTSRKTEDAFASLMSNMDFDDIDLSEFDTDETNAAKAAEVEDVEKRKNSIEDMLKDFDDD